MILEKLGIYRPLLVTVFFAFIFQGCSLTRFVPEGEMLLTRVKLNHNARDISRAELISHLRQQPNMRILGIWRLNLGIYNLSGRDETRGINRWLRQTGEPPVILDPALVDMSALRMKLSMNHKGYYQAEVSDSIIILSDKKAKVVYNINAGPRFLLNELDFQIEDRNLVSLVKSDSVNSLLRRGRPFSTELLESERDRVARHLRNNGFYYFSREYIYFMADSTVGNNKVNSTMVVMQPPPNTPGGRPDGNHARYSIRDVIFNVGGDSNDLAFEGAVSSILMDSINYQGYIIAFDEQFDFKPGVLVNSSFLAPGDLFRATMVERTQQSLSGLRIFKYINIRFREVEGETDIHGNNLLDCVIHVVPGKYQSYALEVEGTNSSGNMGIATNIMYQHKNIFKGAELFTLSARLARQNQFVGGSQEQFNTAEYGGEASVVFPNFLIPIRIEQFRQRFSPKTTIAMAYNFQRRPDYTRTIANARLGYTWRAPRFSSHALFPLDFNLVNIKSVSPLFWDAISNTFLRYAYEDHLIAGINYSYLYNQQEFGRGAHDFWYFRYTLESAGNVLDLMAPLMAAQNNYYNTFMGIRYAQFFKTDVDIRYHDAIDRDHSVTYRFFAGVGVPYGNLKVLPFEKRYYAGGANSIRAWPVRSLGPGAHQATRLAFYNQTADIKLELNVEYRFPIFWVLEGALFIDAGNIWDLRPGLSPEGMFRFNEFYEQIAVGTGFGARFDFNYFLFRIDTGLKVHDPAATSGQRWIPLSRPYTWNDVAFNFAIGYPF